MLEALPVYLNSLFPNGMGGYIPPIFSKFSLRFSDNTSIKVFCSTQRRRFQQGFVFSFTQPTIKRAVTDLCDPDETVCGRQHSRSRYMAQWVKLYPVLESRPILKGWFESRIFCFPYRFLLLCPGRHQMRAQDQMLLSLPPFMGDPHEAAGSWLQTDPDVMSVATI